MKKSLIITIAVIFVAIIISAGIFVFYNKQRAQIQTPSDNATAENTQPLGIKLLTEEEMSKMSVEELDAKKAELESKQKSLENYVQMMGEIERKTRIENAKGIETPEGVIVTLQGDNLIVRNEREGYEIIVPNTWVIADSGDSSEISFCDKEEYGSDWCRYTYNCWYMSINIYPNKESLKLDTSWIDTFGYRTGQPAQVEEFSIDKIRGYKVTSTALINSDDYDPITNETFSKKIKQMSHEYYFSFNGKIYEIVALVEDNLGSVKYDDSPIIQTFKILQ